jgi:hypothetical protein
MSNTLVTSSIVAREALPILKNMLSFSQNVNRDFQGRIHEQHGPRLRARPDHQHQEAAALHVPRRPRRRAAGDGRNDGAADALAGRLRHHFHQFEKTLSVGKLEDKMQAAIAAGRERDRPSGPRSRALLDLQHAEQRRARCRPRRRSRWRSDGVNQRLDEMAAPRDKRRRSS